MIETQLLFWLLLLLPSHADAQSLSSIVTNVSGNLFTTFNGGGPEGISLAVVAAVWSVVFPIGTFLIVKAGMSLINSQEEDKLSKAKQTIASTLIGIMLIYVCQTVVISFFSVGSTSGEFVSFGPARLIPLINGILNWVTTVMAALGILMIIITGLRAIASFGKEEGITQIRNSVIGVSVGLILVLITPAINATLGIVEGRAAGINARPLARPILVQLTTIISGLLGFLALLAVSIVIYAGVMMVVTAGNEEQYGKSRSLIIRALIGLVVILLSYTFTVFILSLVA